MKKFYSEPELEVKKYLGVDILTASYPEEEKGGEGPDLNGDDEFDIFTP